MGCEVDGGDYVLCGWVVRGWDVFLDIVVVGEIDVVGCVGW